MLLTDRSSSFQLSSFLVVIMKLVIAYLLISSLLVSSGVVKGYQVVTKQLDMNHFQLDVVNSSMSMAIMCLYNSQEVVIQKAYWRQQKAKKSKDCRHDNDHHGWIDQTMKINETCQKGTCKVPASNRYFFLKIHYWLLIYLKTTGFFS